MPIHLLERSARSAIAAATVFFFSIYAAAANSDINDLGDLKQIQTKVNAVVDDALPATVSLNSPKNGASGSGVIISKDGLILTAAHVVQGSDEMFVIFPDGTHVRAKVLGTHFTRDSAMMKIIDKAPAEGWPHVEVGDSKHLQTGDFVIALGHPGGYEPTRTPPVRFGRVIGHSLDQFFSTDCTIIGGDSGGPLFDLSGKLVGIHSSIGQSLNSNNHAGLQGFHQDWDNLLAGKSWGRLGDSSLRAQNAPALGVVTEEVSSEHLLIVQVVPESPADKAGILPGDILSSINNQDISNLAKLHIEISKHKSGDKIQLTVLRNKKSLQLTATLSSRDEVFSLKQR
ncbi:MAG: S1C family serine protease [Akkermansiaceae bacterium]